MNGRSGSHPTNKAILSPPFWRCASTAARDVRSELYPKESLARNGGTGHSRVPQSSFTYS